MLIAARLKALGCHVTMLGARYDRAQLAACCDVIRTLPMPSVYQKADEFCSRWLRRTFIPQAMAEGGYDLVIHGGWPLFSATADLRELAPLVFFLDHGVVPEGGYPPAQQAVLQLLHQLRREHLPACTHAAGVSRFIVETQTVPDVGTGVPVHVLLNGADHLDPDHQPAGTGPVLERVRELASTGHPLILNLGRYEDSTYKNSHVAIEVFQLVRSALPAARLLILDRPENLRLPVHLARGIELIGFPDDPALAEISRLVTLGLSTSLWEGYNLPLVELLRDGTPALAFRVGAHAEVVPDPWFLCADLTQMAAKATLIIEDGRPARQKLTTSAARAHWERLTWDAFVGEMIDFLHLPLVVAPATKP
jgi:hypothetical protein